jgi:hypothetical protein
MSLARIVPNQLESPMVNKYRMPYERNVSFYGYISILFGHWIVQSMRTFCPQDLFLKF